MRMSESVKELATALIAVQAELPTITKDKVAKGEKFSYAYVGLDTVMPEALAILNKHGLALTQTVGTAEDGNGTTLTTTLLHKSGEWLTDTQPLLLSKQDPQGQGSAITYARRYGVMSALGMVADEDDDGQRGARAGPRTRQAQTPAKAKAKAAPKRQASATATAKPTAADNNKKAQTLLEAAVKPINAEYTLADAITLLMGEPPEKGKHPLTAWLTDTKPLTVIEAATVGANCLAQMHEELKNNGGSVTDAREVVDPPGQLAEQKRIKVDGAETADGGGQVALPPPKEPAPAPEPVAAAPAPASADAGQRERPTN